MALNVDFLKSKLVNSYADTNDLDLSSSGIDSIESNVFQELKSLERLKLNKNKIITIKSDTFSGLASSLNELDLTENQIDSIDPDAFKEFRLLRVLRLSKNSKLFAGDFSFLKGLVNLEEFTIGDDDEINRIDDYYATIFDLANPNEYFSAVDSYQFEKLLSANRFSVSYLVKDKHSKEEEEDKEEENFKVLKILRKNGSKKDYEKLKQEIKNVFISKPVKIFQDDSNAFLFLVYDYYEQGSLKDYLNKSSDRTEQKLIENWFDQFLFALYYLHKFIKIPHNNISLENVYLTKNNNLVLGDIFIGDVKQLRENLKTLQQNAQNICPELLTSDESCDLFKSDVWSLGRLFYELCYSRSDDSLSTQFANISLENNNFNYYLRKILVCDPALRIDSKTLFEELNSKMLNIEIKTIEGSDHHDQNKDALDFSKEVNDQDRGYLKAIHIKKNKELKISENMFSEFHSLVELFIDRNSIESIDLNAFENLKRLLKLSLSGNQLKDENINLMNDNRNLFSSLSLLTMLDLSYNDFESLNESLFMSLVNLNELFLNNNRLKSINTKLFSSLIKLKKLSLANNQIESIDDQLFCNLAELEVLLLNGNNLTEITKKAFSTLFNLIDLNLSCNHLKSIELHSFEHQNRMACLDLSHNQLSHLEPEIFSKRSILQSLYLHENNFYTNDQSVYLMFYLVHALKSLKEFKFKNETENSFNSKEIFTPEDFTLKPTYKKIKILDEVQHRSVFLAIDSNIQSIDYKSNGNTSKFKAIKIYKKNINPNYLESGQKSEILLKLKHENIVNYSEIFSDNMLNEENSCLCLVMEWCYNGDLDTLIESKIKNKEEIETELIEKYTRELLDALEYIHDKGIIHFDLRPINVFLKSIEHEGKFERNKIKLGDFGISKKVNKETQPELGVECYHSPELCEKHKQKNKENFPVLSKIDVWAFGCILYEICTLKKFIPKKDAFSTIAKLNEQNDADNKQFFDEKFDNVNIELVKNILKKVMVVDPIKRDSIKNVKESVTVV